MADKDNIYIDPNFFLPPNVYDFKYSEKEEIGDTQEESELSDAQVEEVIVNVEEDFTTATAPESSSELPIPDTISVASQSVKAASGGGYLVDLVIEIPDMAGVESYDVAVTKA